MTHSTASEDSGHDADKAKGTMPKPASWLDGTAEKLNRAPKQIAGKLRGTAEAIREHAQSMFEHESISEGLSDVAYLAAEKMDSSAEYLELHDVSQMARDVTGVIKRHQVPALLIAAAVGLVCGRALRRD